MVHLTYEYVMLQRMSVYQLNKVESTMTPKIRFIHFSRNGTFAIAMDHGAEPATTRKGTVWVDGVHVMVARLSASVFIVLRSSLSVDPPSRSPATPLSSLFSPSISHQPSVTKPKPSNHNHCHINFTSAWDCVYFVYTCTQPVLCKTL